MVTNKTIDELKTNTNTGVEYEIALFRCLLMDSSEIARVDEAIRSRNDAATVESIMRRTTTSPICKELSRRGLSMVDVSFEKQNDDVGPADVVLDVKTRSGIIEKLGLSIKFANTCTLNATGRKFLTEAQISDLRCQLPRFTDDYLAEMNRSYGSVGNWFHKKKPSRITDRYIDLIREEVIVNWSRKSDDEKKSILMEAYQETSPIPYWVVTYNTLSYKIDTDPYKISMNDVPLVELRRYQTSYVGFYLRGRMIGKMQVKFNNGFVEKCKKAHADKIVEGVRMSYGQPFTSWNFCLVK